MISRATAALVLLLSLGLLTPGTGSAEPLSGIYYGVDEAAGASIQIKPAEDGYDGTFFDARGNSQAFKGDRLEGDVAEAVLDMDERTVLMRAVPLPFGIQVTLVPFDEGGRLLTDAARVLYFVRRDLELPQPGPDFVAAPRDDRGRISANAFLASYEFWDGTGVRNGYLSLPERVRTLIRLFPAVQLDVIWKLCLAPDADQALALALRGQGVSCAEVIDGMAAAQRRGTFNDYKREVARQKEVLRTVVRCADRYPEAREKCDEASRALSAQAVSMETAATILSRYR